MKNVFMTTVLKYIKLTDLSVKKVTELHEAKLLTLSARPPFQNFSTPCILNVNNTGTKQGSIIK
jgi:hypothetical protein